jgi:chromosome segregation ATPase
MPRQSFLDAGGFDAQFDLFEDWDLLIRLAARGDFLRIPKVTCEVRHFRGGTSIVLAAPEGSERFRDAKLRIWKKHAQHLDHDLFANVFERQKRRLGDQFAQLVEARGRVDNAQRDVARLSREKDQLMAQNLDASNMINGYALRQRELEGSVQSLTHMTGQLAPQLELRGREIERLVREIERLTRENDELRASNRATHQELERTRVEIQRLSGLLDMIYRSRTWKLHTMLEKARGRG